MSDMTGTLALHFGVYPRHPEGCCGAACVCADTVLVDNHEDASSEHPFLLHTYTHGIRSAFVSGSWGCWGPADQDTDGDNSLHVLLILGTGEEADAVLVQDILLSLVDAHTEGRVLDYAVISTAEDWSEDRGVATFTPSGGVFLHPVKR